jgi:hypothetical protein
MPKKWMTLALLAGMVALLGAVGANGTAPGPEPLAPFTGIIKNNTKFDLSVPSENSLGTLILPAKGWIEFVVWDKTFDLTAYKDGKPFFAQKVGVTPKAFPYMTKNYDFMAEITAPEPRTGKTYKKKRYRVKKKAKPC